MQLRKLSFDFYKVFFQLSEQDGANLCDTQYLNSKSI